MNQLDVGEQLELFGVLNVCDNSPAIGQADLCANQLHPHHHATL